MANAVQPRDEDEDILRWGGLAGIVGGLLFILVFAIVGVFVGAESAAPEGPITRFPEIRAARTVENGLYLAVLVLWWRRSESSCSDWPCTGPRTSAGGWAE
jgi:hypothetical protein